jgi:hypothetical protein
MTPGRRRKRRRSALLFWSSAALSLLAGLFWALSYARQFKLPLRWAGKLYELQSRHGRIYLTNLPQCTHEADAADAYRQREEKRAVRVTAIWEQRMHIMGRDDQETESALIQAYNDVAREGFEDYKASFPTPQGDALVQVRPRLRLLRRLRVPVGLARLQPPTADPATKRPDAMPPVRVCSAGNAAALPRMRHGSRACCAWRVSHCESHMTMRDYQPNRRAHAKWWPRLHAFARAFVTSLTILSLTGGVYGWVASPSAYSSVEARHTFIPLGLWLMFAFALCYIQARHARRIWQRRQNNLCVCCGYDLRATPNRCPECGAVPRRIRYGA